MGFVGKEPAQAALSSDDITDGAIVNADINASAAIAMSKTAFSAGTGITLSTNTLNVDAAQTGITSLLATDIKIGEDDQTKIDFEDANKINFYANNAKEVELAENSLSPGTSDGTALGTTSLMWSDLFLASGSVINFNNGDVTLTHSGNTLTVAGGTLATAALTSSTITASGIIKTDDSTNATSTTDGSLQTDGGLSVALDAVIGDDLMLLSDSAILSLGAGNDATLTHDGTTGLTIAATPISIDSTGELHLNSTTGDIKLQDGGTDQITFDLDGTAGEVIMKPAVDSDDLVISQYDGTEVIRIEDNASLGLVGNKLSIANSSSDVVIKPLTDAKDIIFQQYDGTEVARVEDNATFNIGTSKLAINGTAVTATAAELNLLDGGTSVGGSITLADADGVVVNDGGAMKTIPASDVKTYIGSGGGTTDLVADGNISAGDRVAITSAGKAKTVSALQTGVNNTTLTAIQNNGINAVLDAAYSPDDDRFLVLFKDSGNGGATTAQVVDVDSNGDFSIGSELVVESSSTDLCEVEYDTNANRFVCLHTGSDTLKSYVITVDTSDNSCDRDTAKEVSLTGSGAFDANGTGTSAELVFDPDNNKMFAIFSQNDEIIGRVMTVTGGSSNTISLGTAADIHGTAGPAWYLYGKGLKATYDTAADRIVLCWLDSSDSNKMTSVVITISGTGFSVGSEVHVTETNTGDSNIYPALCFDAASGKLVLFFYNNSIGDGEVYIGTCTGSSTNTCSWGSANVLVDGDGSYYNAVFDAGGGNIVYAMEDRTKTNGTDLIQVGVGYVSGTSFVSKQQQKMYTTYIDAAIQIVSGGTGNKIVLFTEDGTSLYGAVPDLPDNAGAFIGIANSAISDTATGTIQLHGTVATNQSSLSAGSLYYLTSAGALTTTATSYAKIGHALTSTTLLIQGTLPDST